MLGERRGGALLNAGLKAGQLEAFELANWKPLSWPTGSEVVT